MIHIHCPPPQSIGAPLLAFLPFAKQTWKKQSVPSNSIREQSPYTSPHQTGCGPYSSHLSQWKTMPNGPLRKESVSPLEESGALCSWLPRFLAPQRTPAFCSYHPGASVIISPTWKPDTGGGAWRWEWQRGWGRPRVLHRQQALGTPGVRPSAWAHSVLAILGLENLFNQIPSFLGLFWLDCISSNSNSTFPCPARLDKPSDTYSHRMHHNCYNTCLYKIVHSNNVWPQTGNYSSTRHRKNG